MRQIKETNVSELESASGLWVLTVGEPESAYGLWALVIINSLVFVKIGRAHV